MQKERKVGLDVLKSFAILFVVSVHFFLNTQFYETPILGGGMYLQVCLQAIFMSCIPLFLLISGYVGTKVDISWSYFKKILNIIAIYFLYSLLAVIYKKFHMQEVESLKQWVIDILTFKANSYSWYVNMYIGLFLISPFLNILFNNLKNKRERQVLVAVLLFISAVPDFLNGRFISVMQFPTYWVDFYPVGFYFLGSYIREYKPKLKKGYNIILFLLVLAFETFFEVYAAKGSLYVAYMGTFGSLIRLILAVLIFMFFYEIQVKNRFIKGFVTLVSLLSLDIYLASYVTDKVVYGLVNKYIYTTQDKIVFWIVPIVLTSFLLAFVIAFIRSKVFRARGTKMKLVGNKSIPS